MKFCTSDEPERSAEFHVASNPAVGSSPGPIEPHVTARDNRVSICIKLTITLYPSDYLRQPQSCPTAMARDRCSGALKPCSTRGTLCNDTNLSPPKPLFRPLR